MINFEDYKTRLTPEQRRRIGELARELLKEERRLRTSRKRVDPPPLK